MTRDEYAFSMLIDLYTQITHLQAEVAQLREMLTQAREQQPANAMAG